MAPPLPQCWPATPAEAIRLQNRLRHRVITADRLAVVTRVTGLDVGLNRAAGTMRAAVAVLNFPDLVPLEQATAELPATFPYVPGLLSFREIPALLEALERLSVMPDLLLCDGQGIAHPRRFGIASHLGVLLDIPSVGVAKSRLIGSHGPVPENKGAWCPLLEGESVIGAVLRTRKGVQPLYVSIGHRISLPTAIRIVMACVTRTRLPETTRAAHRLASGPPPLRVDPNQ